MKSTLSLDTLVMSRPVVNKAVSYLLQVLFAQAVILTTKYKNLTQLNLQLVFTSEETELYRFSLQYSLYRHKTSEADEQRHALFQPLVF